MAESPTVGELFKAKAVTDEQVTALVAWEGYERPANSAHEKSPEAEAPGRCVDGCG